MIPASFDYVRATSLSQAIGLLQDDPENTERSSGEEIKYPKLLTARGKPLRVEDIEIVPGAGAVPFNRKRFAAGANMLAGSSASEKKGAKVRKSSPRKIR